MQLGPSIWLITVPVWIVKNQRVNNAFFDDIGRRVSRIVPDVEFKTEQTIKSFPQVECEYITFALTSLFAINIWLRAWHQVYRKKSDYMCKRHHLIHYTLKELRRCRVSITVGTFSDAIGRISKWTLSFILVLFLLQTFCASCNRFVWNKSNILRELNRHLSQIEMKLTLRFPLFPMKRKPCERLALFNIYESRREKQSDITWQSCYAPDVKSQLL